MRRHEIDRICSHLWGASDEELVGELRSAQAQCQPQLAVRLACLIEYDSLRESYLEQDFVRAAARAWLQDYLCSWEEKGYTASQVYAQGWDGPDIEDSLLAEGLGPLYELVEEAWDELDEAQVEVFTRDGAPGRVIKTLDELERVWSVGCDEWEWVQGELRGDELATFTRASETGTEVVYTLTFGELIQERLFTLSELLLIIHFAGGDARLQ